MNNFKIILFLLLLSVMLAGCSLQDGVGGQLEWLDEKASSFFHDVNKEQKQSVIDFMEENKGRPAEEKTEENKEKTANDLSQKEKDEIDNWLDKKDFNRYGDAKNAVYTGGTPLFNEETGEHIDRYDYILNKYPDILSRIKEE